MLTDLPTSDAEDDPYDDEEFAEDDESGEPGAKSWFDLDSPVNSYLKGFYEKLKNDQHVSASLTNNSGCEKVKGEANRVPS